MAQIHKSRRVDLVERELLKSLNRCPLDGNSQTDESVIDRIATIPLSWVLVRTRDGEMSNVGHVCHCLDESGHIGSRVENRRILLCQKFG